MYQLRTMPRLAAMLLGATMLAAASTDASAQSNTSGNLVGVANAGDIVQIDNPSNGLHRETTVGQSGRFRFAALPTGTYLVKVKHADGSAQELPPATVRLGMTTRVRTP